MLRCNQIVTGLERGTEGLTVNVADTGSPGRRMAGRMVQQVPGALLWSPSHPQQKENSEGKFPNSPEKLSDGMNETLMWVINIVGENAPDSLKDKVQGEAYRCGGKGFLGGERGREREGVGCPSGVPRCHSQYLGLPGPWRSSCRSVMLLMEQNCQCPFGEGHGGRDAPSPSASRQLLCIPFSFLQGRCRCDPREDEVAAELADPG